MPTPRHEELIKVAEAAVPGPWQRKGFMRSLRELGKLGGELDDWSGDKPPVSIVPDSFFIDIDNRTVHMIEVGRVTWGTRAALWWFLDCYEWDCILHHVNLDTGALTQVDLCDMYYRQNFGRE